VVPATCNFVVDVRTTDAYSNEETLDIIKAHVKSEVTARSTRLKSSSIPETHPIVKAGIVLGRKVYGSPTMSDQALIPVPSLKLDLAIARGRIWQMSLSISMKLEQGSISISQC
jgi:acetylornithine deacetylase